MSRKIDQELLQIIQIFDRITHARLKDTFQTGNMHVFVVEPGEIGRAVGRKGAHVKRLAKELGRNIKIVEYSPRIEVFVKNIIHPLKATRIIVEAGGKRVRIIPVDYLTRGLLIGRNAIKLREHEQILKRFYPAVEELRIEYPDEYTPETVQNSSEGMRQDRDTPIGSSQETSLRDMREKMEKEQEHTVSVHDPSPQENDEEDHHHEA